MALSASCEAGLRPPTPGTKHENHSLAANRGTADEVIERCWCRLLRGAGMARCAGIVEMASLAERLGRKSRGIAHKEHQFIVLQPRELTWRSWQRQDSRR